LTQGLGLTFGDEAEVANGARMGYFDTHGRFPAMIKVIEFPPATEAMFGRFRDSSRAEDGTNPVRLHTQELVRAAHSHPVQGVTEQLRVRHAGLCDVEAPLWIAAARSLAAASHYRLASRTGAHSFLESKPSIWFFDF
jgi:hypothetical protein